MRKRLLLKSKILKKFACLAYNSICYNFWCDIYVACTQLCVCVCDRDGERQCMLTCIPRTKLGFSEIIFSLVVVFLLPEEVS